MINNLFSSFKGYITQKTTNPFLGTLLIVGVFKNWKFVYSIFNFDEKMTLDEKLLKIQSFFVNYSFSDLIATVLLALAVLVLTYFLLNLSRLIVSFFEKIITPLVYQLTDKSSIVLKKEYNIVQLEVDRLEKRLRDEKNLRVETQQENEELEKRLSEMNLTTFNEQNIDDDNKYAELLNSSDQTNKKPKITPATETYEKNREVINQLNQMQIIEDFHQDLMLTSAMRDVELSVNKNIFVGLGLISPDSPDASRGSDFQITPKGKSVYNAYIEDRMKI